MDKICEMFCGDKVDHDGDQVAQFLSCVASSTKKEKDKLERNPSDTGDTSDAYKKLKAFLD
eukprot:Pgem_evm1s12720